MTITCPEVEIRDGQPWATLVFSSSHYPFVKVGGAFLAMKGPGAQEELKEAEKAVRTLGGELARVEEYAIPGAGVTHTAVLIRKLRDTPARYPRRWAQMKKQPL